MANPYLADQAGAITNQVTQNLQNNILPGIRGNAMMAGGFGGSRQGIAEGLAIGQTNQGLSNSLAGLYGNAYEGDQNRALQQQSINNQYSLGQGQLALGNRQADNSYNLGLGNLGLGQYQAETSRGLGYGQLAQQGEQNAFNNQLQGAGLQLQGLNALQNWNNLGLGWANQQQQTPLQNLGNLAQIGSGIGSGGATTSANYQGNPWLGALGGAQLGGNLFTNLFSGGK